jgi:chromosome segregation ATPase
VASLLGGRFPYQKNGLLDNTHLKFYGREDLDALLRECGFLWQRWHTVQVDPAQAELKQYWNNLEDSDREFLKARCADGMVYQHVVRAFPASAMGHLHKLQKDLLDLEQTQHAEVSRLKEAFESEKKVWMAEQLTQTDRFKLAAQEFSVQLNSLREIEKNTQKNLDWTVDQLKNHQHSMQELMAEIQALKTSTSWRLTEPLRALLRKISG